MKKSTAVAPANIAFIKYWGKTDDAFRIPLNSSFSMNLSGATTTTTVEFSPEYAKDSIVLLLYDATYKNQRPLSFVGASSFSPEEEKRVIRHLDRVRAEAGISLRARVVTRNSFPKGTGIASSASGFAALTLAASSAAGLSIRERELTILARVGSGSACRSIPDGFVLWEKGESNETSVARSVYPHDYWDLRDILLVTDMGMKQVSSTGGMDKAATSPLLPKRLESVPRRLAAIMEAFDERNFPAAGSVLEEDCLDMHRVMQTQVPPLTYWSEATKRIMARVRVWRNEGIPVYFTIDAGPNVHLICEAAYEDRVLEKVRGMGMEITVIVNNPSPGVQIINDHLF